MRLTLNYTHGNPRIVESLAIDAVFPDSPAARAHLGKGDAILEIEGKPVAGMDPETLASAMQRSVGETLHLRLRHAGGEPFAAALVAAAIPDTH
jgi:C-terminal processing protease CtpA/Prc